MRIVWLRSDENPWRTPAGWDQFRAAGFDLQEHTCVEDVSTALFSSPAAFVCTHEVPGALEFLSDLRARSSIPTILVSFTWSKDEFRVHSSGAGAAHRYAKAPMSVDGFVDMLCGLLKIDKHDLLARRQAPRAMELRLPEDNEFSRPIPVAGPAPVAHSQEDVEAIRRFLQLREQELIYANARVEETQKDYSRVQEEAGSHKRELRALTVRFEDEQRKFQAAEERMREIEKELLLEKESTELVKKSEEEKRRDLELELSQAKDRYESLKTRVRRDLRKIRMREKELEAKLELMRADSDRMVESRDAKVLELQRKIDALEFDLDQLQDSRYQALSQAERYLARLARVSRTLHVAVSMIEKEDAFAEPSAVADLLGGAAEGLEEELSAEVRPDLPVPKAKTQNTKSLKKNNEPVVSDEAEDALAAAVHKTASVVDTSSGAVAASVAQEALAADLENLANDGDPTQMISRPVSLDMSTEAPESEQVDMVEGLEEFSAGVGAAGRNAS